jgi:hypothetical protein
MLFKFSKSHRKPCSLRWNLEKAQRQECELLLVNWHNTVCYGAKVLIFMRRSLSNIIFYQSRSLSSLCLITLCWFIGLDYFSFSSFLSPLESTFLTAKMQIIYVRIFRSLQDSFKDQQQQRCVRILNVWKNEAKNASE